MTVPAGQQRVMKIDEQTNRLSDEQTIFTGEPVYDHFKEAALPDTYRRREINCLVSTLAMQRSVRVAGLSGMGKSNLLRFLVSHPHLLEEMPPFSAVSIHFLYIDCNKLHPVSSLNFCRECNFLLGQEQALAATTDEF